MFNYNKLNGKLIGIFLVIMNIKYLKKSLKYLVFVIKYFCVLVIFKKFLNILLFIKWLRLIFFKKMLSSESIFFIIIELKV